MGATESVLIDQNAFIRARDAYEANKGKLDDEELMRIILQDLKNDSGNLSSADQIDVPISSHAPLVVLSDEELSIQSADFLVACGRYDKGSKPDLSTLERCKADGVLSQVCMTVFNYLIGYFCSSSLKSFT
jgi:hypothetical protein